MNPFRYILFSFLLFAITEVILIYLGIVKLSFFIFIPIFVSSSPVSIIPFIVFIIPFILIFSTAWKGEQNENVNSEEVYSRFNGKRQKEVNYGGFLFIGPVPIIFGKGMSKKTLYILIIVMILIMILFVFFSR